MKVGLLTSVLAGRSRADAFAYAAGLGVEAVELGTGEFATNLHVGEEALDGDRSAIQSLVDDAAANEIEIAAFACHGNPLHPVEAHASRADDVYRRTLELAQATGVGTVVLFSGCPGTPDGSEYPNWVTTAWPEYFSELYDWQWTERVLPYWSTAADQAAEHGVRLAFEMHPGCVVYNTETLLRLRAECGDSIGANFDPSHLWWQGIEPLVSLRAIGEQGAIFHVHAKDTLISPLDMARNGGYTLKPQDAVDRPWRFITPGYGHDVGWWRQFVVELRLGGYDGVLAIEHEDPLAPIEGSLEVSIDLLRKAIWSEPSAEYSWFRLGGSPDYGPSRSVALHGGTQDGMEGS
jgi:sugar phosphate isomerase/epimerase